MLRKKILRYFDSHPPALAGLRRGSQFLLAPGRLRVARIQRRRLSKICSLVPAVLEQITPPEGRNAPGDWIVQSAYWSRTGIAVVKVGPPRMPAAAVVKMPSTKQGAADQQREGRILAALRSDTRLGGWAGFVAARIGEGTVDGRSFVVEEAIAGVEVRSRLTDPEARTKALSLAATAIGELHNRTAETVVVDEGILDRWIDTRLPVLAIASQDAQSISRLGDELRKAWLGRNVVVSWIHGDYWPGNVLVDPGCACVTGIIDWERSAPGELPVFDHLYLLIYARMLIERSEVGEVLLALLGGSPWRVDENEILGEALGPQSVSSGIDRPTLLLFWLRYIALTLTDEPDLAQNWVWVARNVENVLDLM